MRTASAYPSLVQLSSARALAGLGLALVLPLAAHAQAAAPFVEVGARYGLDRFATLGVQDVAIGDLDGDGDQDLVLLVLDSGTGVSTIQQSTNTGTATVPSFSAPTLLAPVVINPGDLALGDLDGDGDLDLLVLQPPSGPGKTDGLYNYYQNTGTAQAPVFAAPVATLPGLALDPATLSIALHDGNADGRTDVYASSFNSTPLRPLEDALAARAAGRSVPEALARQLPASLGRRLAAATPAQARAAAARLAASAPTTDLAARAAAPSDLVFFPNTTPTPGAAPTFGASTTPPGGLSFVAFTMSFGDLDGDSDRDAVFSFFTPGTSCVLNTGTDAAPVYPAPQPDCAVPESQGLRLGQIFGPGRAGAIGPDPTDRRLFYSFRSTGQGQTAALRAESDNPLYGLVSLNSAGFFDADADGDLDLLYVDGDGSALFGLSRNVGTASAPVYQPEAAPAGLPTATASSRTFAFGDLDLDGDLDLLYTEDNNSGTGSVFRFARNVAVPGTPATYNISEGLTLGLPSEVRTLGVAFALADLNGDGRPDVATTDAAGGYLVYLHDGTTTGAPFAPYAAAPLAAPYGLPDAGAPSRPNRENLTPFFVDLDGDGDLDLVEGARGGTKAGIVYLFSNTGGTGTALPPPHGPPRTARPGEKARARPGRTACSPCPTTAAHRPCSTTPRLPSLPPPHSPTSTTTATPNWWCSPTARRACSATARRRRCRSNWPPSPPPPTALTARLSWTTASEANNAGFAIERRVGTNGAADWTEIGFVAGHGTTTERHTYAFDVAALPVGRHAFRLRQVDTDGRTHVSSVVEVFVAPASGALVLTAPAPSPVRGQDATASLYARGPVRAALYDVLGRRVADLFDGTAAEGQAVALRLPTATLPAGLYLVRATDAGGNVATRTVVVR